LSKAGNKDPLKEEPKRRPSSALNLAMALPGGDMDIAWVDFCRRYPVTDLGGVGKFFELDRETARSELAVPDDTASFIVRLCGSLSSTSRNGCIHPCTDRRSDREEIPGLR
jgi:hypothetical protein